MKYYYGVFSDINDQIYKITIKVEDGDTSMIIRDELLLTDSPFVVNYEGDDNLYKPYKCSTATISMLNREFNPELNSQTGLDVEVRLLKLKQGPWIDDYVSPSSDSRFFDVEWFGYATPNAYSQGYNSFLDVFELECQDALSACRYRKAYTTTTLPDISFAEFLINTICNPERGIFTGFYCSRNVRLPMRTVEVDYYNCIFNQIRFNKEVLKNVDDELEPFSILNIIEKICKSLNMTVVQQGTDLWFLSYEAIAQDYNTFSHYKTGWLSVIFYAESKRNEIELGKDNICLDNTNLSLHDIYSDYIVTTDYLALDTESIDLSDITARTAWTNMDSDTAVIVESPFLNNPDVERIDAQYDMMPSDETTNEEIALDKWNGKTKRYQYFTMFGLNKEAFKNMDVKCHAYNKDVVTTTTTIIPVDPGTDPDYLPNDGSDPEYNDGGGISDPDAPPPPIIKTEVTWSAGSEITSYENGKCNLAYANNHIVATPMGYYTSATVASKPEYKFGYMMFTKGFLPYGATDRSTIDQFYQEDKYTNQAMIDFVYENVPMNRDTCILINGNVTWFNRIMPGDDVIDKIDGDSINTRLFLTATIKLEREGATALYYNNGTWSGTKTKVKITLDKASDNAFNTAFPIKDTVQPSHKLADGTTGWCIKAPDTEAVNNYKVTVTIYRSWGCTGMIPTRATFISDFGLAFPISNESNVYITETSDTKYRQKRSEIDSVIEESFALHTFDGKETHLSALLNSKVPLLSTSDRWYLGHVHNLCLGDSMIVEELKIKTYANQYYTPCMILNAVIHADSLPYYTKFLYKRSSLRNKVYVIDTMNIDYKYNRYAVKLYEKK